MVSKHFPDMINHLYLTLGVCGCEVRVIHEKELLPSNSVCFKDCNDGLSQLDLHKIKMTQVPGTVFNLA